MVSNGVDERGEEPGVSDSLDSRLCNVALIFANSTTEELAMFDEIQGTCKRMRLGPEAECKRRRRGGQVGKRNQVVERRAGTSVNPCNSLRSEKQMKTNRQRLPGQSRSMVGRRAATLVDLCSALDNRLGNSISDVVGHVRGIALGQHLRLGVPEVLI